MHVVNVSDFFPVLDDPQPREILDFDEPIRVLMIAVLHFVPSSPALTAA